MGNVRWTWEEAYSSCRCVKGWEMVANGVSETSRSRGQEQEWGGLVQVQVNAGMSNRGRDACTGICSGGPIQLSYPTLPADASIFVLGRGGIRQPCRSLLTALYSLIYAPTPTHIHTYIHILYTVCVGNVDGSSVLTFPQLAQLPLRYGMCAYYMMVNKSKSRPFPFPSSFLHLISMSLPPSQSPMHLVTPRRAS